VAAPTSSVSVPAEQGVHAAAPTPGPAPTPTAAGRRGKSHLTADDHHFQNASELFAVTELQRLAEAGGVAHGANSVELLDAYDQSLAKNGHTHATLQASSRGAKYLANAKDLSIEILARLIDARPEATFSFVFTGREGRLERRKGDFDILIHHPGETDIEVVSVSLKNYANGIQRIQVCAGTFQSFALGFILDSEGVGKWHDPVDDSRYASPVKGFSTWRDAALVRNEYPQLVAEFHALDKLNQDIKDAFINSEDFLFYDKVGVKAEQVRVGTAGAACLERILSQLPPETVRQHILKTIGFDGAEDLLVVGGGKIADTFTDQAFAKLLQSVRRAPLTFTARAQTLHLSFGEPGAQVLSIDVPCTINTNGAWYRDGEPYEGTRLHVKEQRDLAWCERRPRKCRQIATSINTYLNLKATGVLRDLPHRLDAQVAS